MRFPIGLSLKLTGYLIKQRLLGRKKFPLVLMLEPLHACNFSCSGCGRIREYADTMKDVMPLDACLAAVDESGAPIISVCGGEPLIYPKIGDLLRGIIKRGRYIYLCTNAMLLEKKLDQLPVDPHLFVNVHLDGLEGTHDKVVEFPGSFKASIAAIKAAKVRGHRVCTNTTVYKETDMDEVRQLFDLLVSIGVDGLLVSPGYSYSAVEDQALFLSRHDAEQKFQALNGSLEKYPFWHSRIYFDFLRGDKELNCLAWGNPTCNIRGWRSPCYSIADQHYKTMAEMYEKTPWEKYGRGSGEPRCEHCMTHCGYEPSAVFAAQSSVKDAWKMFAWNFR